jgi:hypothetical protein
MTHEDAVKALASAVAEVKLVEAAVAAREAN